MCRVFLIFLSFLALSRFALQGILRRFLFLMQARLRMCERDTKNGLDCTTKFTRKEKRLLKSVRVPIRIQLPTLRILLNSLHARLNNRRLLRTVQILYSTGEHRSVSLVLSTAREIGESFRVGMLHFEILQARSSVVDGFDLPDRLGYSSSSGLALRLLVVGSRGGGVGGSGGGRVVSRSRSVVRISRQSRSGESAHSDSGGTSTEYALSSGGVLGLSIVLVRSMSRTKSQNQFVWRFARGRRRTNRGDVLLDQVQRP